MKLWRFLAIVATLAPPEVTIWEHSLQHLLVGSLADCSSLPSRFKAQDSQETEKSAGSISLVLHFEDAVQM